MSAIDIFVGTDRSQLLAVSVLEHSIKRHTRIPCKVSPLIDLDLPEPHDVRQGSRTNFSFARFAIPELKNYRGKAIYLDADMLVFRDINELWSIPFGGAKVVIQEELPDAAVRHTKVGAPEKRKKQCSVMLIDCERARWNVAEVIAGLDGQYTYEQLMSDLCVLGEADIRYGVPFSWNSLEHFDGNTRLIHYTDMNTQPWVSNHNKCGYLWMTEVRLMLSTELLNWRDIETEVEQGYFRPSLLRELREMPHANGWNPDVAREYDEFDRRANYVKHAEVYARKKARGEAAKRYEEQLKREQDTRAA